LLSVWQTTKPFKSTDERTSMLSVEQLLKDSKGKIKEYEALSSKGEYSVKFLILLAKLLMLQEKTNLETAYMFKRLLDGLRKDDSDIFSVVSIATHNGR
jgi:hypothetical protein